MTPRDRQIHSSRTLQPHSPSHHGQRNTLKSARHVAFDVLTRVEETDAYANLLLPTTLRRAALSSRDAAFATELVYGTLRQQLLYDHCIAIAAHRPVESLDTPVRILLRLAAHQSLALRVPSHASVDETVRLAVSIGLGRAKGLINAVARRLTEHDRSTWIATAIDGKPADEQLAIEYSHPVWIVAALRRALGTDGRTDAAALIELLDADNTHPPVQVTALPGRATREELVARGAERASWSPISVELPGGDPSGWLVPGSRVQDQGSALAALALVRAQVHRPPVQPDIDGPEHWLDVCAGPGGKAAILAVSRGSAVLECNELQPHRADLVRQALRDARAEDVPVHVGDGVKLLEHIPEAWDRILLDAPCTGLGALRRRPEARWRKRPNDLQHLMATQRALLTAAFTALRPGGVLAYVTCSPHIGETVNQINRLRKEFASAESCDTASVLREISPGIPLGSNHAGVQLWPDVHQSDAMFISLITKAPAA